MEIQGVWLPLDVLKYITQFLWISDHRDDFDKVCRVFRRALREDPPKPPMYVVPEYGSAERGLVTTVKEIVCYTKRFKVRAFGWHTGLVRFEARVGRDKLCLFSEYWRPQESVRFDVWYVEQVDLPFFRADTGFIGTHVQVRNADYRDIVQEMFWLYHFARRHVGESYSQVNERKLLKHKRPRKRVKRFGF